MSKSFSHVITSLWGDKKMELAKALVKQRNCGIDYIDAIPWGTHICGFYQTKEDLLSIIIPYFKAGLENNEFCMWVTSEPICHDEAMQVFEYFIPKLDLYLKRGQIEFLSHKEWYIKYGDFNGLAVLDSWIEKIKNATSKGYEGIRICGNTTWLKNRYWKSFIDYEKMVNEQIANLKMIALCTYQLDKCDIQQVYDIVNNHQFSFIRCKDTWDSGNLSKFDRIHIVSEIASSIAHEIRNPLTTVRGFLQLIQNKDTSNSFTNYFNLMIEELDRANVIISEFLSLSRNKEKNIKKENINDVLRAMFPLLQADAIKNNNEISMKLGDIFEISIDGNDIRQIILNLVRNGLEAMNAGGILTLSTHMKDEKVVLSVQDQGSGISEEIINKIGTPFITTKECGTGLGLAACYSIASQNNAHIHFHTGSSGTTFYVKFKTT
ncbi:MAG TPA: hypothetical protein DEF36_02205 [Desulfotomaculum sp.]|nr:hypothetical protein [Desulfotomaculum sp.]